MNIDVFWHSPIYLKDGRKDHLIYSAGNLGKFEGIPGVYMFCRVYDGDLIPLYIGKANDLKYRIERQLNTTKLMRTIQDSPSGKRVLVLGEFECKPGQKQDKCISMVEKALIEHALADGCELVNQQGTKRPYDAIEFRGNSMAKAFTEQKMYVKKR